MGVEGGSEGRSGDGGDGDGGGGEGGGGESGGGEGVEAMVVVVRVGRWW